MAKKIANLLAALLLTALLAFLCWQIYLNVTGEPASQITKPVASGQTTYVPPNAETAEVQQMSKLRLVQPNKLSGSDKSVVVRSTGSNMICQITADTTKLDPFIPAVITADGSQAKGAGAICSGQWDIQIAPEDQGKCDGWLQKSTIGLWDGGRGVGSCLTTLTPLLNDMNQNQVDNLKGERFKYSELGYGSYTRVGDYACTFDAISMTCLNMATGAGFNYSADSYSFF